MYMFKVSAQNKIGISDPAETEPIKAESPFGLPGPPVEPKAYDVTKNSLYLVWQRPWSDGGSPIIGYILEKREKGEKLWRKVNRTPHPTSDITLDEMIEDTEMEFQISAVNEVGVGPPADPIGPIRMTDPMGPPDPPINLDLSEPFADSIIIHYAPPLFDGNSPIIGYEIERAVDGTEDWEKCNYDPCPDLSYEVLGLKEGLKYNYRVKARNAVGPSQPSEILGPIEAKDPEIKPSFDLDCLPKDIIVRAGETIKLDIPLAGCPLPEVIWTRDGKPVEEDVRTSMHVTRESGRSGRAELVIVDSARKDKGALTLTLKNKWGEASGVCNVQVLDVPGPPLDLYPSQIRRNHSELSWKRPEDDGGSPITNYLIFFREAGRKFWSKSTDACHGLFWQVDGLVEGKEYYYKVHAANKIGEGPPAEIDKIRAMDPIDPPGPCIDFQHTDPRKDSLVLNWKPPKDDGGSKIIGYNVELTECDKPGEWRAINDYPISVLTTPVLGLTEGTEYVYRVNAQNAAGVGPWVNLPESVLARDPLREPTLELALEGDVVIKAGRPLRLEATYGGRPTPKVSWLKEGVRMDPDEHLHFELTQTFTTVVCDKALRSDTGKYTTFTTVVCDKALRSDTGKYTVTAINEAGRAKGSVNVEVIDIPGPCTEPWDFSNCTRDSVDISWGVPEDDGGTRITNYILERRDTSKPKWQTVTPNALKTKFTATQLLENHTYEFRVSAENRCGAGPTIKSKPIKIQLPFGPPGPPESPGIRGIEANAMTVTWDTPLTDGGSPIIGYIVEKREKMSGRWGKVNRKAMEGHSLYVDGLIEGAEYEFRIYAENMAGVGPPSQPTQPTLALPPMDPPGPPQKLHTYDYTKSWAAIRWEEPLDNGGGEITGYCLEMTPKDKDDWLKVHDKPTIMLEEFTISDLVEGKEYEFRCKARNAKGFGPYAVMEPFKAKDRVYEPIIELEAGLRSGLTVRAGHPIRLAAYIRGKPDPEVWWEADPELDKTRTVIGPTEDGSECVLKNSQRTDSGLYKVTASNDAGEKSATCMVTVLDVPGPPRFTRVKDVIKTGCTLQFYNVPGPPRFTRVKDVIKTGCTLQFYNVPGPPRFTRVKDVIKTGCTLQFKTPEDNGGSEITNYVIERREATRRIWTQISATVQKLTFYASNLQEGTDYVFRVAAENLIGVGDFTEFPPFKAMDPIGPPGPPQNLEIYDSMDTEVSLSWDIPKYNGGSPIVGYVIECRKYGDRDWKKGHTTATEPDLKFTLTELPHMEEYEFAVKAVNEVGAGKQAVTDPYVVREKQVPPSLRLPPQLTFKAGTNVVLDAALDGRPAPKVEWYKGDASLKPDQRTDISQSLIDTICTVQHCTRNDAGTYFVTASNNSGKKSAECEVTIYGPPGPPQDLNIDSMTANTCTLSWHHPKDDGGSPVTCYLVQRKEMPDGKWVLVKGDVPVCSFIVPRLIEGKSYAFRVIAENKFGTGPGTETRPKMIKSLIKLPGPPENPMITDVSRNMMIVCWEPPLDDGGSPITGYWLEKRDSNNQRWFKVSKAPIVGTRERVTGLYANVEYDFRTSAINAAGVGPPSKPTKPRVAKDQAIPPGPPRPQVVDTTRSSVTLEWEPPARDGGSPIIGYYVEMKKFRGEADWERCHDTELVRLRELVVPDLNEGEEYWFRVFAVNEVGEGPPGDVPGRVIVKERIEEVEMDLDADIKEGVTVRAGQPVRLMAYFKGRPEPKTKWSRVGTEAMMRGYPENTSISTALIIKTTARSDTGKYALTVENKAGAKTMQTSVTVLDVPGPVINLHPSHVTKRTVTLVWQPPEDDGGSRVTKYRIEKRDVSRKAWQRVSDTRDVTITIMDLVEEAEYIFQVCAENKYGVGAPSETQPVTMAEPLDPPGPPENLTVTDVTKHSVGITWEPPKHDGGSKVTHYVVEMKAPGSSSFEKVESKVTQLFYNFLELSEGEAYTFRACAVNAVGAGPYAQTPPVETREKLIPPGIRLQEEMTVRAGETINIAAGITGKPVPAISWERGGKPLMAVDRVSLVNDASSSNLDIRKCMRKIDQGVYQVTAKNKVGTASKQIKVTILDVPGEPNDVKISRVFANEMTVTWSKPYQDGGSPITNYVVDRRDVHMVTWTQVSASIDPKKMVIVAHKLLEGVEYVFRVRAENNIGVGPPGPPEAPEITASGRNWLNIVWQKPKDDGGAPVTGYWLERKEPTGARWMQINRLAIEDMHHKVTGLVEGTQYEFRVAAENRAGIGPPSFPSVPRAPATPIRLPGPPTPKVVDVTRRSVSLRWLPPEDDGGSRIIGYVVERRQFDSDIWDVCHETERIVGQELTMGDLTENTKYVFRVSAVNLAGQGESAETPGITQVRDPTEMPDYELDASVKELMVVKVGTPLRIPVFIKGKPRPSMEWSFNGQPLVNERMKTENTEISHTLVISPCEKKDAGRYTLHLQNPLGDVSVNIRVKVVGPPGPPTTPFKVGRVLENAVPLSWGIPDDNGGSDISNYIVEKRIVGQKGWYKVSSNVARTNIVVSRLEKDYQYLFRVAAENQYGIGPFIETDGPVTASDPIVPPDMPEHLDITRVTRKTVELVWKRPKYDGGSPITGYIVESRNLNDDIDDWNLCNDYVLKDLGFIVTGLIENDKYEFKVAAQNKVGTGKYNNTRAVQVKDEIEQPDCNIDLRLGDNITVKEGTTIDIGARIKGKPDLQVTWTADENAFTEGGSPRSSRASTPAIGMTARVLEASERVIMTVDAPKARLEVMNARRSDRGKYAITVSNKAGKKSSSINVNVLAKPGPPTKLNIDEITNSYAILNWEPPEDDGGSPVLNYVVHKKDTARNVWAPVAEAYPVAKQTIHIPNLLEGSEYVFRVQAENQIGIGRPNDSMPIVARWRYRVPDAPDAPSISDIRRNAMTATWREPFNGGSKVTGYYLEKKEKDASRWLPVNQEPIPSKTHRITGLLEGMDYVFRVKAENRAGVGPPGPPSRPQKAEDPIDPPGPVVDPECYEVTRSSASIRWKKPETDGGSRILGYIVEKRKADSDLWTSCHDTEMHRSLELVVPSLLTGQKYVFRVCAANRAGHGPWEAVPGTILIKEREEPLVLNLDASFKELYVLRAGSVLRIPVMIGGRPEPKIEWFKEGQKTHGRTLIENTAISTTLLIKNCYKSDAGEYMLRISNQSGKKECRVQVRVVDKPSVPLNLRSKPEEITSDMIPLYWDAPEDDGGAKITHYIVEKREAKRAAWASVCNTVRTTCIAPELVEKMVYEFRVRAVNEIGEGENALSGKIRCQPPLSPPGPPLMLDVEDTSKDSILLDWDPPREDGGSKILGYFVEMKGPEDTDWRKVNMESFTSSRWEVKGLRDDVDYDFQVKATNAIGVGPPSEPITGARCFELPSAPAIDLAISMRDLVVVKAGTPIKLHARIEGYPYPSAQWLSKGEPLEAGDRYSMKTTKSTAELVVKPSLRSDTGRYHLVVKNLAGTRKAPINVKVLDRPGPPQAPVQFEDIHQDQVTLRWSVPADDGGTEVTNYIVERREAAKTFWTTVNSNLSRTRIMVPKLIEGTPYVFRIKAENKMGISDPLDSEPVTPKSPYDLPGPPLELRIINVQSDTMSLTWLEPDFDGGSPVQGYFLEKRDKISKRWLKIEKDMLTTTTYKVGGLIEGFSYEFRVSAKNVVGTGPPSEPTFPTVARPPLDPPDPPLEPHVVDQTRSTVDLEWDEPVYDYPPDPPLEPHVVDQTRSTVDLEWDEPVYDYPPDPPLEPHVVDQTRSTVDLEWDEPVYDGSLPIEGYLVEHRLKGVETWTKSHDTSMVANMYYTVAGLEEGREYQFRVFAINGAGKSKPAEVPGFTVVRDITIYPEIELDASCKDTVYARANQNVRLPVYIKGRPDPKIMWSKEGKDLPGHITIEKLAIGEVLKMKVSRPDSGRYTVQVSNVCGEVSKNINLVVLDRPGPPRNIVVKYVKKDSCVLNWDIPEDDGGSQITNYIVERRLPNENLWRNVTSNIRSRVSKVTGLNEGYSYFFRVKAENKYGIGLPVETTEPTLAADPIDRPTEPRDLEVTAVTNNSVSLKWVKPTYDGGSPLTTYLVERCRLGESDHTRINTDDLLETEYTATGLNPGAKYEFRVKARNIRYIGPPSTPTPFIEARDDTKPPKIELDLRLLDVLVVRAGTKVHLEGRISGVPLPAVKWSRGGKEIATSDHYEVTTIDKETCLTLRSARRRDTGSYDVNVTNSAGAMNATAKVIVQDVPGPPVGPLKIRDMTSESMTIEWKMPHDDGGAEVTSYLVEKMDTKIGHWFPVDTTVTKFSLKVTQLMEDHEYQFRIRGRNKIGLGEPFVSKPRIAKRPYDLPGPPSAPIVHTIFPDNATLIWQPPESDGGSEISRYILEKKDINSIKWVRAVETISSDTRYNVPNLVEGMEYQFRAAAENAAGLGKFGPPSTPVIAREPIDLPDPPVTPKCVDTTRSSATIAWKKPILDGGSDIVGYLVEYRAADSENWEIGTPKIHTLQFVVTELTEGAEYYFRVSAINEAGVGPPGDCPGKVLIKDILASPDFELDASMKKTLTVRAGQPIRMYVSISGRPQPEIHWEKEGQPLDYRAEVENTEYSSQLAIYNTNRYDAGRYDLILKNAVGEKTASVNVKVFDTPGPPGPIAIKEVSKDHMVITWTPPTVDGGSAVSNYIVEKRDESRRTWTTVTTNNPKLSCRIPNLVETVTYFFQVFAENKYGIGEPSESMPAKAQDAVGPPGPVVKLHVADITRITAFLEWTKPTFDGGSKVTGYVVETQEAGSIEWDKAGVATECHYQVLGLTPGHGYRFRVKAQNAAGQGDPTDTEIHKAQDEKIAPKINLDVTMRETVVVKAGHTLTIYAGISGKPVPHTRWAKDGAMMKPDRRLLFKKSHTETRFSLKEVTRNDAGTYALRAYNDAGEKTANVFVKVLDKPGPPASLQIDEVTADSVSISWRPPTDNGGVEVNNYLVERCDVQRGVWLTVNANVTRFMFKFPDLMKGREYAFRVMAENRIGVGEPAATEKVVARDAIEPPGPPSAPEITEICKDAIGSPGSRPSTTAARQSPVTSSSVGRSSPVAGSS
ncbi:titin-like [Branchiostoma floridae x Branchiostoma belcheri]